MGWYYKWRKEFNLENLILEQTAISKAQKWASAGRNRKLTAKQVAFPFRAL